MKFIIFFLFFFIGIYSQKRFISNGEIIILAKAEILAIDEEFTITGNGLRGYIDFTDNSVSLVYDLWNLDTGIQLRNEHMHLNYLETEDFPEARFTGTVQKFENDSLSAKGKFYLHGIEKALSARGSYKDGRLQVSFFIKLTDYNIEIPRKFLVAKLSEILEVQIIAKVKE